MAVPTSHAEPPHMVRASIKLQSAGLEELAGRGLRQDLQESLGGERNVPHLEASVRPGCVHLVVNALRLQASCIDHAEAIATASAALAAKDVLWRKGEVLIQLGNAAAVLHDGVLKHVWVGEDFQSQVPEMPCAAPFAAAMPGTLFLRISRSFLVACKDGEGRRLPKRLLARSHGRFFADINLQALASSQQCTSRLKEVRLELDGVGGPGLAWLETELNGFISKPLPIVLCTNIDIVEEVRLLEAEVAMGRRSWAETSALLADVGLVLEYAALLGPGSGRQVAGGSPIDAYHAMCLQHVARVALRRLACFCELGWPAMFAQALPVAAVGRTSLREVLQEVQAAMPACGGTLLHAAVRSESVSMVSLLLDLSKHGFNWDLRAKAEPQGQTVLHVAANIDDEGQMAGLLLHSRACPEAGLLWSVLKNAAGQTPADIAFSASKARPGRIFLLLSPAERAAIGPYGTSDGDASTGTASSSCSASTQSSGQLSLGAASFSMTQASSSSRASAPSFSRASSISPRQSHDDLQPPVTPFLAVKLPPQQQDQAHAWSQPLRDIRTRDSAPLLLTERSGNLLRSSGSMVDPPGPRGSPLAVDDRIIRKSLSADTETHNDQLRFSLLPAAAAAATFARPNAAFSGQELASLLLSMPASIEAASPEQQQQRTEAGLSASCHPAVRVGPGVATSPSVEELQRIRRAIAEFGLQDSCQPPREDNCGMQRLSIVMGEADRGRNSSANVEGPGQRASAGLESLAGLLPICMSAPSTLGASEVAAAQATVGGAPNKAPPSHAPISFFPEAAPQEPGPPDHADITEAGCTAEAIPGTLDEAVEASQPLLAKEPNKTQAHMAHDIRPGQYPRRALPKLAARHVAFLALLLVACSILPGVAVMSVVALAVLLLAWQPNPESQPSPARVPDYSEEVDKLEAQVYYGGWRRHLLCFKSGTMERNFLHFHAGVRWELDIVFSVLFTLLAAMLLGPGGRSSASVLGMLPWLAHTIFAGLPATIALSRRAWYLKHRESIMLLARIGCQLSALICWNCTAALHRSPAASTWPAHDWLTALAGDALAALFQLIHLPVGFQIRSFLQLPLVLLTVQLRVKVRRPASWPQMAVMCALMLLPFRSVAQLERRARRGYLAECVRQRHLPVPPRPLPAVCPSGRQQPQSPKIGISDGEEPQSPKFDIPVGEELQSQKIDGPASP